MDFSEMERMVSRPRRTFRNSEARHANSISGIQDTVSAGSSPSTAFRAENKMTNNHSLFKNYPSPQADRKARELALREAMTLHSENVIRFITGRVGDPHLAEELAYSLWGHVYRTFQVRQFNELGLLIYAARQFIRKEFRRMKARKRIQQTVELRIEEHDRIDNRTFSSAEAEESAKNEFWELFQGLDIDPQLKELYWLKHIHGYTFTELADRFEVSRSTVHEWTARLTEQLRQHLAGKQHNELR